MNQKTIKMCKHISVMMLAIMLSVFAISGADKLGKVYADCSVSASYDETTKTINASGERSVSNALSLQFVLQIKSGTSWSTVKKTIKSVNGINKSADVSFELTASGTYRIELSERNNDGNALSTVYSEEMLVDLGGSGGSGEIDLPHGIDNPKVLELPCTTTTVVDKWIQTKTGNAKDKMYYKLVVKDKAYYNFRDSKSTLCLYEKMNEVYNEQKASSSELNSTEQLLDVGEYLLVAYGVSDGEEANITVNCRDFVDIKSIAVQDKYEVFKDQVAQIKLAYTPASGYESTIKWESANRDCMEITDYNYNNKSSGEDKSVAYIYGRQLGTYTAKVTTSEGVTKTITVLVKPNPAKVSAMTANTKTKKKATLTVEWEGDTSSYAVYLKKGNDFAKVADVNAKTYTFKNLVPGKTYTVRVESVHKDSSTMSNDFVAYTAPYAVPSITSSKQKGNTTYKKPYYEWHWNNYKYVKVWYGNRSSATLRIKFKKVKGASYYNLSFGDGDKGVGRTSGTVYLSYRGKIKAKSQKLKLRAVFEKGKCIAYGPWSKARNVKVKGSK